MKSAVYLLAACALSVGLSGCASKRNPLIDEPLAKADNKAAPAAASAATPAADAKSATASTISPNNAANGVQTTAPLTSLQRFLYIFTPFRVDVQQGNFISQEQVALLKEGMTRDQVRFVLGSPLLTDVFHADRWDYVFRVQKASGETTSSKVTVFFKDERLQRFTGNDLPTEQDYIARLAGPIIVSNKTDVKPAAAAQDAKPDAKADGKTDSKQDTATPGAATPVAK